MVAGRPARTCSSRSRRPRPACRRSPTTIAKGISVNVTLIFSLERYRAVMDAYLAGLEKRVAERRLARGHRLGRVVLRLPGGHRDRQAARQGRAPTPSLKGKAGIANAQLAYQAYEEVFSSDRWRALEAQGRRAAAAAVGLDRRQEPGVLGHDVHQRAHRARHGQHDAREDDEAYADHGSPGTPVQKSYDDAAAVMQVDRRRRRRPRRRLPGPRGRGRQKFVDSWDELTE